MAFLAACSDEHSEFATEVYLKNEDFLITTHTLPQKHFGLVRNAKSVSKIQFFCESKLLEKQIRF